MSEHDHTRELHTLLEGLEGQFAKAQGREGSPANGRLSERICESPGPVTTEFILSFLVWEAGLVKAGTAAKRLAEKIVDCNELRICLEDDIAGILGVRYPRSGERAARLRSALNAIFDREHQVSLEHVSSLPKRDARAYLASLEGTPPFVTNRVALLALGSHAFPLDERLNARLRKARAMPDSLTLDASSSWLERQFRAGELERAYVLLEAADAESTNRRSSRGRQGGEKTASAQGAKP